MLIIQGLNSQNTQMEYHIPEDMVLLMHSDETSNDSLNKCTGRDVKYFSDHNQLLNLSKISKDKLYNWKIHWSNEFIQQCKKKTIKINLCVIAIRVGNSHGFDTIRSNHIAASHIFINNIWV